MSRPSVVGAEQDRCAVAALLPDRRLQRDVAVLLDRVVRRDDIGARSRTRISEDDDDEAGHGAAVVLSEDARPRAAACRTGWRGVAALALGMRLVGHGSSRMPDARVDHAVEQVDQRD